MSHNLSELYPPASKPVDGGDRPLPPAERYAQSNIPQDLSSLTLDETQALDIASRPLVFVCLQEDEFEYPEELENPGLYQTLQRLGIHEGSLIKNGMQNGETRSTIETYLKAFFDTKQDKWRIIGYNDMRLQLVGATDMAGKQVLHIEELPALQMQDFSEILSFFARAEYDHWNDRNYKFREPRDASRLNQKALAFGEHYWFLVAQQYGLKLTPEGHISEQVDFGEPRWDS